MPTDSIVYVVIVCIVILAILGIILVILKCRSRKEENVLLADYMWYTGWYEKESEYKSFAFLTVSVEHAAFAGV